MLETLVQGGFATATASLMVQQSTPLPASAAELLPSGVTYEIVKKGDGPKPEIGELVAIRFAAYFGDRKIDDIFDTPEPYYTRLGSGGLLKGVESTLPEMRVGDRWKLIVPVSMLDRLKEFSVKHRLECPDSHFRFSLRFRGLLPLVPRAGKENFMLGTNRCATPKDFTQ
jgi:hypothetical protein